MKKRKTILSLLGFPLVALGLLFLLQTAFDRQIVKNLSIKNYWLLNKENEAYDIAFIGNSRVFNNLDMDTVNGHIAGKTINLGLEGAAYAEQYLFFHLFLKKNKIKTLAIEVNYSNLIDPDSAFSYPFHEYYYFPFMNGDTLVSNTIQDNAKRKAKFYFWKYFPFFRYAEFNENIGIRTLKKNFKAEHPFDSNGSYLIAKQDPKGIVPRIIDKFAEDKKTINYLDRMISYAKSKGIRVVLFTAPTSLNLVYSKEVEKAYTKIVSDIRVKNQVDYINFERISLCEDITNFKDKTHLNKKGAQLFSRVLGDSLKTRLK